MRFHLLLNPLVPSHPDYGADAFNQLAIRWAELFAFKGHTIYFYGTCDYEPKCSNHNIILINIFADNIHQEIEKSIGSCNNGMYLCLSTHSEEMKKTTFSLMNTYTSFVNKFIYQYKQSGDFILHFYGCSSISITQEHPELIQVDACVLCNDYVTPNVCYSTCVQKQYLLSNNYRVPATFAIIPPFFNAGDFIICEKDYPKNYFLYLGRIQFCKGVHAIFALAKYYPHYQYIIAGYYNSKYIDEDSWIIEDCHKTDGTLLSFKKSEYPNVKLVGFQQGYAKAHLLAHAKALIQPTQYWEPFGFNIIEAYLSGTPVITPKKGAFEETVLEGITGFKCHSWDEYTHAQKAVDLLDRSQIIMEGMKYTQEPVYNLYMEYFEKLTSLKKIDQENPVSKLRINPRNSRTNFAHGRVNYYDNFLPGPSFLLHF